MDLTFYHLGKIVFFTAMLAGFVWLAYKSPLFRWLVQMVAIVLWGLVTVGATLAVVLLVYLPQGRYAAAAWALLLGLAMSAPWYWLGWPALKHMLTTTWRAS